MRFAMLGLGDLHCGSQIGLHPPEPTELDDGGLWVQTHTQGWLWDCYEDCLKWAKKQIRSFAPDYTLVLINGDSVDGPDHHGTYQTISRKAGDELIPLERSFDRLWSTIKPDGIVVNRGTESHVGRGGSTEETWARQLDAMGYPIIKSEHPGVRTHWFFEGFVPGKHPVHWNATHHGKLGQKPWTTPNSALSTAVEIELGALRDGRPVPDICYRSHLHRWLDTGPAQPVRMIALPAFQVATAFGHQKYAGKLADIGMALTLIDTDQPEPDQRIIVRVRKHRPIRTRDVWQPTKGK